jgi:hypothetical protein
MEWRAHEAWLLEPTFHRGALTQPSHSRQRVDIAFFLLRAEEVSFWMRVHSSMRAPTSRLPVQLNLASAGHAERPKMTD